MRESKIEIDESVPEGSDCQRQPPTPPKLRENPKKKKRGTGPRTNQTAHAPPRLTQKKKTDQTTTNKTTDAVTAREKKQNTQTEKNYHLAHTYHT